MAVSPVADQAEWILQTIAEDGDSDGEEMNQAEPVSGSDAMEVGDSGRQMPVSLWLVLGSVVVIAAAAVWRFSRR